MSLDYNISFDEIREDRDKLLAYIKDAGGPQELADRLEVPYDTLNYWRIQKHGIMYDDYKEYKKGDKEFDASNVDIEDSEENTNNKLHEDNGRNILQPHNQNLDNEQQSDNEPVPYTLEEDGFEVDFSANFNSGYEYKGDHYLIETRRGTVRIKEELLQQFKRLYCGNITDENLTKKQCIRELGIPKDYLMIIKRAFDITHNDIEFTDEEIANNSQEHLTKKAINIKKDNLKRKIRQEEYKQAIKENKKFREKDYYTDKTIDRVLDELEPLKVIETYGSNNDTESNGKTLVINISDWHTGKLVESKHVIGETGFNKNIYRERIERYTGECIDYINEVNPERVLILDYGDGMDNPEANQYKSQQKYQDISYEDQIVQHISDVENFILSIYQHFPKLLYSKVLGNHSKGEINWDILATKMLNKIFTKYDDITINDSRKPMKTFEIYDYNLIQTHGDYMTNKIDTPSSKAEALGIANMEILQYKTTYIVQGHLHHQAEEGPGYVRIILPSIIGGDDLSNNRMKVTSRPAQQIFLFEEGQGLTIRKTVYLD